MSTTVLTRLTLCAAGLVLFTSCASSRKAPPAIRAAVPTETAPAKPDRQLVAPPDRPLILVTNDANASVKEPTRTEEIIRGVRPGTLVETSRAGLVFSLPGPPPASQGGLFEDAIVLSRLRGQLKKVPGLPESVPSSATVQSAKAYLRLNDEVSVELVARAIDTALKTNGITVVHVTTTPDARL